MTTPIIIASAVGFVVGGTCGVFIMALLAASGVRRLWQDR